MYTNEEDLLDLRIRTGWEFFDKFVIVEATKTHSGKSKPLFYKQNEGRFSAFHNKIVHIIVDDMPIGFDNWARENHQREAIKRALVDCEDNDVIFVSDCDEIPSPEAIKSNLHLLNNFDVVYMVMDDYEYYFNVYRGKWKKASFLKWKNAKRLSFSDLRGIKEGTEFTEVYGGWHFSWLGGTQAIIEKLGNYAHAEYDLPFFKLPQIWDKRLSKLSEDMFGHKLTKVEIGDSHPKYLVENQELFKKYLAP